MCECTERGLLVEDLGKGELALELHGERHVEVARLGLGGEEEDLGERLVGQEALGALGRQLLDVLGVELGQHGVDDGLGRSRTLVVRGGLLARREQLERRESYERLQR
jgi:hypothetical protein